MTLLLPKNPAAQRDTARTNENGVFELKAVNPGTYVLAATALSGDDQIGFSMIKVIDEDYLRAEVVIGPGVGINTRLFGTVPSGVDLSRMQILLIPLDSYIPAPAGSTIQSNGSMTLANVQPGNYALHVSGLPDTAYVRAAQSDSRDVLERFVQVQYESQAPLEIRLAFDGGQIAGTVANAAGAGVDGATVVLVPDKARRLRPDQYRAVLSSMDGKFSIAGIPPGDYKLFAWESVESNAWLNSDFLLNYEEFGSEVSIGPNGKITGCSVIQAKIACQFESRPGFPGESDLRRCRSALSPPQLSVGNQEENIDSFLCRSGRGRLAQKGVLHHRLPALCCFATFSMRAATPPQVRRALHPLNLAAILENRA